MSAAFLILVALHLGIYFYRRAKRRGVWSWSKLLILLAAFALLPFVLVIPLAAFVEPHPGLVLSIVLGGTIVITGVISLALSRPTASASRDGRARSDGVPAAKGSSTLDVILATTILSVVLAPAQTRAQSQATVTNGSRESVRAEGRTQLTGQFQPGDLRRAPALTAAGEGSGPYRDPQGRYSLTVPDGWTIKTDASGSAQLASGPSWATIIASSGSQPIDVNHQILQQIQAQYKEFRLLNEGDLQVNGHPAHGSNATGVNPKGARVSLLAVSISAGSGHFLTVVSSAPNDQAKSVNGVIMQMTQSIRFAGE